MVSRGTTLTVTLTGDASQLKRVLGGADRDMQQLERASGRASSSVLSNFTGLAIGATAMGASLAGALAVAKSFADAASDLNESQSKLNVVFGSSAGLFNAWGDSAATALGMSKQQAIEAAGAVGNFTQALGVSQGASVDMSKSLVQLASDLASFNNSSPEEVLLALRSGLSGEVEPLRRFGVAINAAAVENRALAMGLAATKDELTEGAKVQARYALIMEQTKTAQGDFARTAREGANASRTFTAQIADLRAEFGTQLLPIQKEVLNSTNDLIALHGEQWARDFATAVDALALAFQSMTSGIASANTAIEGLSGISIPGWLKLFGNAILPGSQFLEAGASSLWNRAEQQQLQRLEGSRAAGLTEAEAGNDGWAGIPKAIAPPPEVLEGLEAITGGAKGFSTASTALNDEVTHLTGAMAVLTTQAQALVEATEAAARAEADLLKQRQQAGVGYINSLNSQGVQRYAPGVFETIAGAFGLNTNFDAAPTLDVAVP